MPIHTAYGLSIESDFEIPELATFSGTFGNVDVKIRYGEVPFPRNGDSTGNGRAFRLGSGEFVYVKRDCGRFLVKDGTQIQVDPDPDIEDRVLRLSLFGPALALLLMQRGYLVLHGGAVAFSGNAVVLLGPAGMGKSTLTAELCKLGGELLTDDVVTIDTAENPPKVLPGVPLLKLWPDAVDEAPEGVWTKVLHPDFEKLGLRMKDTNLSSPAPVARVFFLGTGKELGREPITGAKAFTALMGAQFAARYGEDFISGLDGNELLGKLAMLIHHAPIEILRRPRDKSLLGLTAETIAASV